MENGPGLTTEATHPINTVRAGTNRRVTVPELEFNNKERC